MKLGVAVVACISVIVGILYLVIRTQDDSITGLETSSRQIATQIELRSDPFPLRVGQTTLDIMITDTDGTPIEDATVYVDSQMNHDGMLPLSGYARALGGGYYEKGVIFPMMGEWTLDITAELPDGQGELHEQFVVYVYPVTQYLDITDNRFQSVSELDDVMYGNPSELWVRIPQGAQSMIMTDFDADVIPTEMYLQVSGQNTLVIRNDDFEDHIVGPYFVRAGETIRQTFTRPAVFQGTCSIRHDDIVRIIVEE